MKLWLATLAAISLLLCAASAQEQVPPRIQIESVGVRYGFGEGELSRDFAETEALAGFTLPTHLDLGRGWELRPRLQLSLGSFGNSHETVFMGSAGIMLSLTPAKSPVAFEMGFAPTILSGHEFGTRGVGTNCQFRSWFGLSVTLHTNMRVGYHYQHMSNAGLADENSGVNMHTISVSWRF